MPNLRIPIFSAGLREAGLLTAGFWMAGLLGSAHPLGAQAAPPATQAAPAAPRLLTLDDLTKFQDVGDPRCSPDGKWVSYTLTTTDAKEDKRDTDVWMVSTDGTQRLRITSSSESENSPRFSPDGRYLAFASGRPGKAKGRQIWLLDRRGGEAQQLTELKGDLASFEWSPDGKRLALVYREEEETSKAGEGDKKDDKPKPIVITRYAFKRDGAGYQSKKKKSRIYLFELETKELTALTSGGYDESQPAWSPDGAWIAFVSNQSVPDPDRTINTEIWVAPTGKGKTGGAPTQVTRFAGSDGGPVWSPDGRKLAFLRGSAHGMGEYDMDRLMVVELSAAANGGLAAGEAREVLPKLDRPVQRPQFSQDGRFLDLLVVDDMSQYPARVPVGGGTLERTLPGKLVATAMHRAGGCQVALVSSDTRPAEVSLLEQGQSKALTDHNAALLKELKLAESEEVRFRASDGNEAHGLLTKPVGYVAGNKVPMLLRIHGGPNSQDAHNFSLEAQMFAAHGYAVLRVNYRGSNGRGEGYTKAIAADWGNKEVLDLLAGVDHVVAMGVADPNRLGVGGWSYGGILTNYLVATTTRFKAATSGAGVAFPLAFYGHDQYIHQYDNEIGTPWGKGLETWLKISYPFLKADRIKTPTLYLCGDKDFNVPLLGSEQMYQALRNVGTATELIIYPGENHGISRPSFQRDRMQRYLNWYDHYIPGKEPKTTSVE